MGFVEAVINFIHEEAPFVYTIDQHIRPMWDKEISPKLEKEGYVVKDLDNNAFYISKVKD